MVFGTGGIKRRIFLLHVICNMDIFSLKVSVS